MIRIVTSLLIHVCMIAGLCGPVVADDTLTITTWNIEHLGSPGRGFGGGYGGYGAYSIPLRRSELPSRTPTQLKDIAQLIRSDLKSDIIALQEIAITGQRLGRSTCKPLDAIVKELETDGSDWCYYLPTVSVVAGGHGNQSVGFLWNRNRVRLLNGFPIDISNQVLAGKDILKRQPLVGYFESLTRDDKGGSDFVLVNVHLASGQDYDENHLIAMTLLEHELSRQLGQHGVTESDQIILGDFNDNPFMRTDDSRPKYSPALYTHMSFKGYVDLVSAEMRTSRMNAKLDSLIDHVMVNSSALKHVRDGEASIHHPHEGRDPRSILPAWRMTYSDHFPISFRYHVLSHDDDTDFFK